jgi:hypothetical protein
MITKISKKGWEKAYYGKWLKAQDKTRRKVKWNDSGGWRSLEIEGGCSYCMEIRAFNCLRCSLSINNKHICSGAYQEYIREMNAKCTNWKRANELVDKIVEAIRQDGEEWGYLDKNK